MKEIVKETDLAAFKTALAGKLPAEVIITDATDRFGAQRIGLSIEGKPAGISISAADVALNWKEKSLAKQSNILRNVQEVVRNELCNPSLCNPADLIGDTTKLFLSLMPYDERLIKDLVYARVPDFSGIVAVLRQEVEYRSDAIGTILLTEDQTEKLFPGWKKEELIRLAFYNTRKMFSYRLEKVYGLPILTDTGYRGFGANAILFPDVLADMEEKLSGGYYIIPSSVQEVILMPDAKITSDGLNDIIRSVNASAVKEAEILCDHAWHYHDGKITAVLEGGVGR